MVKIYGIEFTDAAAKNIEETNCDVEVDLHELRLGRTTEARLLADCLDGADEDRVPGWHEYVATLVAERDRLVNSLLAIERDSRSVVNGYDVFRSREGYWMVNAVPYTTIDAIVARVLR